MEGSQSEAKLRILATANRLFHSQGYQATGINQIIKESGIVKSTLYYHFPSKESLAITYLNERHSLWFGQLCAFIENAGHAEEKILLAFDFIDNMNNTENYRGCAFIKMLAETNAEDRVLRNIVRTHKDALRSLLNSISHHLKIDGDIVYQLFESAMLESHLSNSNWPIENAKNFIQLIIKHHGTKTSSSPIQS